MAPFAKDTKGTVLNVKETWRKENKYSVIKDSEVETSVVLQEHVQVWMLKFAKDKTGRENVAGEKKEMPIVTRLLKKYTFIFFRAFSCQSYF